MNCPVCGRFTVYGKNQCTNCGYILPYHMQNNGEHMNDGFIKQPQQTQENQQNNYGYQQGYGNNQNYYDQQGYGNQQSYYSNNQPKKDNSGLGIIIALILIVMLLCCGGPIGITLLGLDLFSEANEIIEDENNEYIEEEQDLNWHNKRIQVLSNDLMGLNITLLDDSIISNDKQLIFSLDLDNKSSEKVEISITDIEINDKEVDYELDTIILGSNTRVDGYEQTLLGETYIVYSNIDDMDSLKFKFDIYYPDLDKTFETTDFYITKSGFNYEANVINAEDLVASNENKDDNSSKNNNTELNYYGSEYVGYVALNGVWARFKDTEGSSLTETTVQYSNGSRILTMDIYKDLTAHVLGTNLQNSLSYNSDVKDIIVLDDSYEDNIEYYQLLAEYNDGILWTVILVTDYNTGNTLYFSYETYLGGADKEEFLKEAHDVISTYTVESGEIL